MPKKAKKAEKKPDARYEAFCAEWRRASPYRLQRQRGRGKPGDMNYRPPLIGKPRPHKTRAADFLDELLWLGAYLGNDCFNQAYVAVNESGAIKDGKWARDLRVSSPPGHTLDPFHRSVSHVARLTFAGWPERLALAWAVATFDLPGATFGAAVARMRKALLAAKKAGVFPVSIGDLPEIK
jgi:hypothetical protein